MADKREPKTSTLEAIVDVSPGAWLLLEPGTWNNFKVLQETDLYLLVKTKMDLH